MKSGFASLYWVFCGWNISRVFAVTELLKDEFERNEDACNMDAQVKRMFQERMESIMLQDRSAMRAAWRKFDPKDTISSSC